MAQLVKNLPAMQETPIRFLGQEDPWRRDRLPTPIFLGFPGGSAGKESACSVGGLGLIPGLGRSPGEGNGYPLQYSGLENSKRGRKELDTTERLSLSSPLCGVKELRMIHGTKCLQNLSNFIAQITNFTMSSPFWSHLS